MKTGNTKDYDEKDILCKCQIMGKPVSVNRLYRKSRTGMYKIQQARDFEESAIWAIKQAARTVGYDRYTRLDIDSWRKDRRDYDLDNIVKQVQDCIEKAGVITNDHNIIAGQQRKFWGDVDCIRITLIGLPNSSYKKVKDDFSAEW